VKEENLTLSDIFFGWHNNCGSEHTIRHARNTVFGQKVRKSLEIRAIYRWLVPSYFFTTVSQHSLESTTVVRVLIGVVDILYTYNSCSYHLSTNIISPSYKTLVETDMVPFVSLSFNVPFVFANFCFAPRSVLSECDIPRWYIARVNIVYFIILL